MKTYLITVEATATIRETWRLKATEKPTPEEAAELLMQDSVEWTKDETTGRLLLIQGGLEFVKDEIIGDEDRAYGSVEVEEDDTEG